MNNLQLNTHDKMLIIHQAEKEFSNAYNANKHLIINNIEGKNNDKDASDFGHFWLQLKANPKTIAQIIADNNEKIAKLVAENEALAKRPQNEIIVDERTDLYSKTTDLTKQLAQDLIHDNLLNTLTAKRISNNFIKAASKTKTHTGR